MNGLSDLAVQWARRHAAASERPMSDESIRTVRVMTHIDAVLNGARMARAPVWGQASRTYLHAVGFEVHAVRTEPKAYFIDVEMRATAVRVTQADVQGLTLGPSLLQGEALRLGDNHTATFEVLTKGIDVHREDGPAIRVVSASFSYDPRLGVWVIGGHELGTAEEEPEGFATALIKYKLKEAARG